MEAHWGKGHLLFLWWFSLSKRELWPPARDFFRSKISMKKIKKKGSRWRQIWSVSSLAQDMNIMNHKLYLPPSISFCMPFCPQLFFFSFLFFLLFLLAFFMSLPFSLYLYLYNKELLYSVLFYKPFSLLSTIWEFPSLIRSSHSLPCWQIYPVSPEIGIFPSLNFALPKLNWW